MAFKIFAGGATLPAADLNDYLMEQSIIVCTSGTRPSSPAEGWTIYETDTDLYKMYSGSAWVTLTQPGSWTSYTPVVTGSLGGTWTVTAGSASRYHRTGRTIAWHGLAAFSSRSGIPGTLYLTLPVAAEASVGWVIGTAQGYDSSANVIVHGVVYLVSSTNAAIQYVAGTGPSGTGTGFVDNAGIGGDTPWIWAANDQILWTVEYEAAS